jgi:2-polyprenyl-3-methyl-5-hydroxy-6-metoxy-1,4-benzoquinol methylase
MSRVDKALFDETNHYKGKPADFLDKIVSRRIELVQQIDGFCDKKLSLVEIGCGNGASIFLLADKMKECTGIDINQDHKKDFEDYKNANGITNCSFIVRNIENDNKTNEQFDRLISFEVIEHFKDEKSIKFYYDSLKAGGIGAITVPNKWWIFETHGAKLPLLPWNRMPFFSWLPKPIHEKWANARIYTKKRIRKLLESVGFEVVNIYYITAPLDVLKEGKLKTFFTKYIFNNKTTKVPFMATSIFVEIRKK